MATFSEKCAHTSRKYLTEQGMGVVKLSENQLVALQYFHIRILLSKVASNEVFFTYRRISGGWFCKSHALIPRKYMVEQDIRVSN